LNSEPGTANYGNIAPIAGSVGLSAGFVKSSILDQRLEFWVFRPEGFGSVGSLPILYLLHGTWAASSDWIRLGEVHMTARRMMEGGEIKPFVIVCLPDGGRGDATGYVNWADGSGNYEDSLMKEIIPFVEDTLEIHPQKTKRGLAGLSMGAFGAYHLGLRHHDVFGILAGHSGFYKAESLFLGIRVPRRRLFSSDDAVKQVSPMELVEKISRHDLPALRFDCGTDDSLLEENRHFESRLRKLGLPFEYDELPGGHDWNYWRENVKRTLLFMGRYFEAHKT